MTGEEVLGLATISAITGLHVGAIAGAILSQQQEVIMTISLTTAAFAFAVPVIHSIYKT